MEMTEVDMQRTSHIGRTRRITTAFDFVEGKEEAVLLTAITIQLAGMPHDMWKSVILIKGSRKEITRTADIDYMHALRKLRASVRLLDDFANAGRGRIRRIR